MNTFHVTFIGCALEKFSRLMSHVSTECGYRVSYIVTSAAEAGVLLNSGVASTDVHHIDARATIGEASREDIDYLKSLEREDVPTVHNMIMSDSVLCRIPYVDAMAYAAFVARSFRSLYRALQPSVVIGGHDRLHASMGSAVANAEGIPWFALNFSVIPVGHVALSTGVIPHETVCLRERSVPDLREMASTFLQMFEERRLKVPAYESAHSVVMVARKLGQHLGEGVRAFRSQYLGRFDRYNEYTFGMKARQYMRKRKNMVRLPHHWFMTEPPPEPFLFFGMHMQPESTPDVYAPFFANQFDVIEKIARAMPPTHKFLVKLHISDADNYSRRQLGALLRLPGVRLVLPTVSSRTFIDSCAAVVTIAGTMGLEAALLGIPVLVFGKMNYEHFPTVRRVKDLYDLPELIRSQLSITAPTRDAIVDAYARYLNAYFCAAGPDPDYRVDDWTHVEVVQEEMAGFVELFRNLEAYLQRTARTSARVDRSHVVGATA